MKRRRISGKRTMVAGSAVAALVAAGLTFQTANASDDVPRFEARTLSAGAAGKLAATLDRELGADAAGAYYDAKAKTLVVNVVDEAAAERVRRAGGKARTVENSLAELKTARQVLADRATLPGTSWAVDPVANKVRVTADGTVDGAAWKKLSAVVQGLDGKAELTRTKGEFTPLIAGGDAIWGSGSRCSLGFNVVKGGDRTSSPPATAPNRSPAGRRPRAARRSGRTRAPASRRTTTDWSSTPPAPRTRAR